ncbi:MAG TPA: SulP family inorganic anion transporter [Caulobacteraceae bacterium]|nr:SulP family inorganic anion transporter [Caulobacteraceae bacterium]
MQNIRFAGIGVDLAAGLTLAAIAVPEQMATARLAGLPPQVGLFAFVAATVGFAIFGANRVLSAGADSTIAPIFAGSLGGLAAAGTPHYAELAAVLALLVGVMVAVAGMVRMGWVADLLSKPVLTGFMAGIALHIVLSQAPAALGLPEESGNVYHRLGQLAGAVAHTNGTAAAIAFGVLAITMGAERISPRVPGALIALAGATIAAVAFGLARHGLPVLGALPTGLPKPVWPRLHPESLVPLVGLTGVVGLVVMVQTAAVTRSFNAGDADPDVDRDYVGVGAASVLAGVFGAFPVNASPPRTAAVSEAGGRSQVGGLAAAAAVLLLAAFGGSLLADAPTAALAGVLFFVAQRIFKLRDFVHLARRAPAEFGLASVTAVMIVLLPIQTGVAIGIFLSLVHGVFTITRARLIPFEHVSGTTVWWPTTPDRLGEATGDVLVVGFQAPLSFLNAFTFRRDVEMAIAAKGRRPKLLVLEASSIVEVDFTAAEVLIDAIRKARSEGVEFAMARLESVRAQAALERFGVMDVLGPHHIFHSVQEAIAALDPAGAARPAAGSNPS